MSTVKISALPVLGTIDSNTANTIMVVTDLTSLGTFKINATTLANGLYANNTLNVGNNAILLPNTVAQFAKSGESYVQTNFVNTNNGGSADHVVTANTGTDSTYFVDMGYANKDYQSGSEFNNIGTAVNRLDGYIYAQGSTSNTWGGNLIVGSTTTGKEIRFIAGGGSISNVVAKMNSSAIILNQSLVFPDGSTQNTALGSAGTYANAAFVQANTPSYTANSAAAYANAAFLQANTAFTKANNALANTSGTFAGNLIITGNTSAQVVNTGNLTVVGTAAVSGNVNLAGIINVVGAVNMNATLVLANSNFLSTESAVTIKATANTAVPSNDGYMLHISGKQNTASRLVIDSYSVTGNAYGLLAGRTARGTVDSPLAAANNDVLLRLSGNGHGGAAGWTTTGVARIDIVATENYSLTNRGSQIQFWNCPIGSNTLQQIAAFNGDTVHFSGVVNPQKGFIYSPNVLSGITTTLNIDIANNSLYRFTTNATTTINLSNFQTGKVVEVWLTNTDTGGGSNHTITHGCLANNSTIGATSFTLTSLHSAYIKYFSIDGDIANTFCQVTYS
jgi:hypothetical protein